MHLKIFTLNCWALPWWVPSYVINCPDRKARIKAIAGYLASSEHDIICLQEVWSQTDQDVIQIACQDSHPYSIVFCGGVVGTGTMILSKWPIVETNFRQFSMNGFKHEIWYGDALAGSGIGMAKVKIGQDLDAFWVNVFVSHYHAEYDRKKDKYKADRIVQALEAGEWIQLNTRDVDAVVYCGDLNTEPGDLAHLVLTQMYQLNDTQAEGVISQPMSTCYDCNNTYRNADGEIDPRSKTIDYILFKSFLPHKVLDINRPLSNTKVESTGKSYSDHEALAAEIIFGYEDEVDVQNDEKIENDNKSPSLDQEIRQVLEEELQNAKRYTIGHFLGILFAIIVGFYYLSPALGVILLFISVIHMSMISVYMERQWNLKGKIQNLFGFQKVLKQD